MVEQRPNSSFLGCHYISLGTCFLFSSSVIIAFELFSSEFDILSLLLGLSAMLIAQFYPMTDL